MERSKCLAEGTRIAYIALGTEFRVCVCVCVCVCVLFFPCFKSEASVWGSIPKKMV